MTVDFNLLARTLSGRGRDEGRWFGDDGLLDYPERCEQDELLIFGRLKELLL